MIAPVHTKARLPARVKNGPGSPETPLPVYPDQRTSSDRPSWSGSCQQPKSRTCSITSSACRSSVGGRPCNSTQA